jgi:hypothetical protein
VPKLVVAAAVLMFAGGGVVPLRPGDVRVCSSPKTCLVLKNQRALDALTALWRSAGVEPPRVATPPGGAAYLELRNRAGFLFGLVSGPGYDRFYSVSINLNKFSDNFWYALPAQAKPAIAALAAKLHPRHLPPAG